jgi:hypothetical protein
MLALFSGSPYSHPKATEGGIDLRAHLTNTCLQVGRSPCRCDGGMADWQTDAFGAPSVPEELVKLFWELEGLDALQHRGDEYSSVGSVTKDWLEATFTKVGEVVAESVKAGVDCGSFGLQLMPNAFEVS